jgi:hypothetical protein
MRVFEGKSYAYDIYLLLCLTAIPMDAHSTLFITYLYYML